MGEKSSPPLRATRAQDPDPTPPAVIEATAALAHRLRIAAATPWDGDQCDTAAAAFITELQARGWAPPRPAATWRPPTSKPADPTTAQAAAAQARAAIRANRPEATP